MHYVKYNMTRLQPPPATDISRAIERYLAYLHTEENKSPLTVRNYRESLTSLLSWLPVTSLSDIRKDTIRDFKLRLSTVLARNGKPLSLRTRNHHITVLRAFLRYLVQEEEMDVYPPDRIRRFKETQRQVKVLTAEELQRMLHAPDCSTRSGKRDAAILQLFFSTGLRLAELRSLDVKDINTNTREISVRGKRGKIRVVFLSDRAVDALREYQDARTDALSPLFIRHPDRASLIVPPGEQYRLSRIAIYNLVKKYARTAGIVSDPSPHTLRHSFATDLLRNGADLRSVQELLGHQDLSTTQIYTHVTNPQLKEVHRKFHSR